jgi:hypothetical protein
VEALSVAIRRYATDRSLREAAGRAAREAAERRYCWEHDAPRLVRAVEGAVR